MAVSVRRRIPAVVGIMVGALALMLPASPAAAQVQPGAQATPLVGSGIVANCPPGSPGAVAAGTATVGGVTVGFPAGGRCTPLAADAEGSYVIAGVNEGSPLPFTAQCANVGGTVQTSSGVTVPAGTIVNGVAVATPTVVTTPNTPVTFPGGRTAILNQVITTPTRVTVNAIAFTGGPIVGQVVCGAAVYPLAVDVAGAADALTPGPLNSSNDGGGLAIWGIIAGAVALAVAAQLAFAAKLRQRKGDATA